MLGCCVLATTDRALDSGDLPREILYVLLAAPIVIQPIVNPDFFHEPAGPLLLEIAANYMVCPPGCADR
jgi:hypothetical protein